MNAPHLGQQLDELVSGIRARRDEIERERRLPRDLVDAMCATGMFGLEVPRDLGGREATPREILQVIEAVSRGDGSAGWCAMVGVANNGAAGFMQEQGAREVLADAHRPLVGIFAPSGSAVRVDGGVRVAGRSFLYDSVDAVWHALEAGETPTQRQLAFVRMAAVHATEVGAAVTRTASVLAGGSSIRAASVLQRHMRDADAIAHHFSVAPHVWEDAGRVLLGRPPTAPMF